MSRNNDRLSGPVESSQPPEATTSRLLDFVQPTQFVEIPSKGKHYPSGHPLKDKEVIEINFMTAKDEDILSSRSLLKNGTAIDRFLQNIITDKKVTVDSLLIGDKNAIIVDARISAYGQDYTTEVTCPNCGTKDKMEYDLQEKTVIESTVPEAVALTETGTFKFILPISGFEVEIKILTSKDESLMMKRSNKKKKGSLDTTFTDQYKLMIVSVDNVTDKGLVNRFIEMMPIKDSKKIREVYKLINPNVELKFDFECRSCDYEQELEVPFGAEFFWPDR